MMAGLSSLGSGLGSGLSGGGSSDTATSGAYAYGNTVGQKGSIYFSSSATPIHWGKILLIGGGIVATSIIFLKRGK